MAKIYLSYSHADRDFALELARTLRGLGHQLIIDVDTLQPGQDWRRALESGLRHSDVFVVLLSKESVSSQYVLSEIGAARAYAESSEGKALIPVILDQIQIPPVVADLMAIVSPKRNVEEVSESINRAVSAFEGKRAAVEDEQRALSEKIQTSAAEYVDDAITSLLKREKRDRWLGVIWQFIGFVALGVGVAFVVATITQDLSGTSTRNWPDFAQLALRSVLVIALLGACAKYAFILGACRGTLGVS